MFKELLFCVLAVVVLVEPRSLYNFCCSPVQPQSVQYRAIAVPQQLQPVVYRSASQPVFQLARPANPQIQVIETSEVPDNEIPYNDVDYEEEEEPAHKLKALKKQKAELEREQAALAKKQAEVKRKLEDVKKKLASKQRQEGKKKKPVKKPAEDDEDEEEPEEVEEKEEERKKPSRKDKARKNEDEDEEEEPEKPRMTNKPTKKVEEKEEPEEKSTKPKKEDDKKKPKEEKKKEEEEAPSYGAECTGGFSNSERAKTVNAHNLFRSEIARGVFKAQSKKMPAATDMRQLTYDCELEKSAQKVADTCVFAHSKGRNNVGENLYTASGTQDQVIAGKGVAASDAWAKEFQDYGWLDTKFTTAVFNSQVGHATQVFTASDNDKFQMAWAKSYKIGCGAKLCKNNKMVLIACHYKDGGNMLDDNNYTPGKACSACPEGTKCDDTTKLCV